MKVKVLRGRLAAFDDETEIYIAPSLVATRVGESSTKKVPHPLRQFKVEDLCVVGDVELRDFSAGERRAVLVYDDQSVPAGQQIDAAQLDGKSGSGGCGPMGWDWHYSARSDLAWIELSGEFHPMAFEAMFYDLVEKNIAAPGRRLLFDNRSLDLGSATEEEIIATSEIFARNSDAFEKSRVASVMGSARDFSLACGFEEVTKRLAPNLLHHPFLNENEAISWLFGTAKRIMAGLLLFTMSCFLAL
jgi:hypothetical protein